VGFVEPEEIDRINIYWAGLLAMRRAVEALGVTPEHLLIDARRLRDVPIEQQAIVKGDAKSLSIAAASILAKTARDARMRAFDDLYPGYGFAQHKGYPVRAHARALRKLGACPIHRRSFEMVREVLGLPPLPPWPARSGIPPELSGEAAALAAAAAVETTTGDLLEAPRHSHT
jgi:ribonuclease HII